MRNFCTIADNNFYNKARALNHSLGEYSTDYMLHLLCIDDEIYQRCKDVPNVTRYKLSELMTTDPILKKAQTNQPSREALINSNNDIESAKKKQFIWSLSPYFTWWCLDNLPIADILYVDADIYFFSSCDDLYNSLEDCSVGIVEHRCPYNPVNGKYNVGIVYFKNDLDGYKCATWWKNCLLLTNHKFYLSHGTCGDQKYLELFSELFDNVKVLDPFVGHLAPWNFLYHQYTEDKIIWNDKEQDLLYCHFSNFKYNEKEYKLAERHGLFEAPNTFIKRIADNYYTILKEIK